MSSTKSRRKKLEKLYHRQGRSCCFCGVETWLALEGVNEKMKKGLPKGFTFKQMATIEHKKPKSQGGTDRMSNLAMSCSDCNNKRGTMSFELFSEIRSDTKKWRHHCQQEASALAQRDRERKEKSEARLQVRIWKLGLLFYIIQLNRTNSG